MTGRIRRSVGISLALAVPLLGACDALLSLVGELQVTTVRLVNNGDFDVNVRVALSDEDDIPEDLLDEDDDLEFTIGPGQATSFTRNCDDLRAVMVTHAELRIVGGVGPEADSGVQRDGDDFACGDVITFEFDHSDLIVDFRVTTSVE